MDKQRTLIFFGAHPDDESFGIGSTLAQYAAAGVKVYYVCTTGGEEGTVDPEYMKGYSTIKELRAYELKCATRELGLAGVFSLGYRDSGMLGSESNKHPESLVMAPIDEVAGRMVKIIREIKPDVIVTHDAGGGYGHPDHIATHNAAVKAFDASADPAQYAGVGPAFKPAKLYFSVRPFRSMKIAIKLMPLFGQDPHRMGRNRDIDFTKRLDAEYPIHAVVRLKKQSVQLRNKAAACHASQMGGGRPRWGVFRLVQVIDNLRGPRDYFMREYPPPTGRCEKDLFEGLSE